MVKTINKIYNEMKNVKRMKKFCKSKNTPINKKVELKKTNIEDKQIKINLSKYLNSTEYVLYFNEENPTSH